MKCLGSSVIRPSLNFEFLLESDDFYFLKRKLHQEISSLVRTELVVKEFIVYFLPGLC